jgi:hypothetical protein
VITFCETHIPEHIRKPFRLSVKQFAGARRATAGLKKK